MAKLTDQEASGGGHGQPHAVVAETECAREAHLPLVSVRDVDPLSIPPIQRSLRPSLRADGASVGGLLLLLLLLPLAACLPN